MLLRSSQQWMTILAAVWLAAPALYGQASAGAGSMSGVVLDQTGSVMPGVDISVRNVGTNVARTTSTNEAGRYEVVALQPGEYEVTARQRHRAASRDLRGEAARSVSQNFFRLRT